MSGILTLAAGAVSRVVIVNHTLTGEDSEITTPAASAAAQYRINADGTAESLMTGNGCTPAAPGGLYMGEWLVGGGNPNDFEVRATLNSGTLTSGTTGTWLAPSTSPSWRVAATRGTVGSSAQSANLTIEIRRATTLVVVASATIVLSATANFDA